MCRRHRNTMSDKSVLDELEALERAATSAPWGYKAGVLKHYVFSADEGEDLGFSLQEFHPHDGREVPAAENAQLIAALRNAAPALLSLAKAAFNAYEGNELCVFCHNLQGNGGSVLVLGPYEHKEDCPLAALTAEQDGN